MKNKLIDGLESVVRGIGKSVKKNAKKALIAGLLPFAFVNNAKAVEGYVSVDLDANGIIGGYFTLGHVEGGTPGIDKRDSIYFEQFSPDGTTLKSVSVVNNTELDGQSESPEGEPVGTTCNHSLVIQSGRTLTVGSSGLDFTINAPVISGYSGYTVLCDGVEASTYTETGTIPAGTYNGPMEISLGSTDITFSKNITINLGSIDTGDPTMGTTTATVPFTVSDDGYAEGDTTWTANVGYREQGAGTWTWTSDVNGTGEGTYQKVINGLNENTQYDFTSRITNSAGTSPGDIETGITGYTILAPTLRTGDAINITYSSAGLVGFLDDDGDPTTSSAETRFVYYTNSGQQLTTSWQTTEEGTSTTVPISELTADALYWYYFEGRNSDQTGTGSTESFRTKDPNDILPIPFDSNEPDSLLIQNFVKAFQIDPNQPHKNQGLLTYVEKAGNFNGIDSNDIFYIAPDNLSTKIISSIPDVNLAGENIGFNELSKDARPFPMDANDPNSLVFLELSIYNLGPNEPNINSENNLKFYIADVNSFEGKPLTIQQISIDPNFEYPVWDIRNIISKNKRILPLDYIVTDFNNAPADPNITVKVIEPNIPYAYFTLSTCREIIDIDDDGIIDLADYALLLNDFGKQGKFRTDIASFKNNSIILGIPDGEVNEPDELAFIAEYNKRHPDDPLTNPYESEGLSEDFESGQIQEPFTSSGDSPWTISTDSYQGDYCAKTGDIEDRQKSVLKVNVDCTAGEISFYRKVSSEDYWDNLIFYIDDEEIERWSGDMDWEEVNFQTTPGTHNFKWIYEKDRSDLEGEDAAWIDNININ